MNEREGDELRNTGYMYSLMTIRSMIGVRTVVIDMGRKSVCFGSSCFVDRLVSIAEERRM